jgi:hypothetical protein
MTEIPRDEQLAMNFSEPEGDEPDVSDVETNKNVVTGADYANLGKPEFLEMARAAIRKAREKSADDK